MRKWRFSIREDRSLFLCERIKTITEHSRDYNCFEKKKFDNKSLQR